MTIRRTFAFIAALLVAACATLPKPGPEHLATAQVRWPETTLAELAKGRKLYVRRCSGCHSLPLPSEMTAQQWPRVMRDMGTEYAKMDKAQQQLALRYVISVLETPPPSGDAP